MWKIALSLTTETDENQILMQTVSLIGCIIWNISFT